MPIFRWFVSLVLTTAIVPAPAAETPCPGNAASVPLRFVNGPPGNRGTDGSTPKNCSLREERQDTFSSGQQLYLRLFIDGKISLG